MKKTPRSPLLSSAASASSFQSFDTIRQAPSTAATSIAASDDHRWSEVVPPEAGLTFAVVWDPEEKGILTFSTAELAECSQRAAQSPDSPTDASSDNRSQVLTITPSIGPTADYTATPATTQFFRQNHDFLFADPGYFPDRPERGKTQTSSTLDGLDVYLRGSMLAQAHNANRYYSCFQDLDGDFAFDPCTSFAHMWMGDGKGKPVRDDVSDEGFFEGGRFEGMNGFNNMSSRFSGTTTSTSNFVTVENEMDDEASADWSALEAPNTPGYSHFFGPPSNPHRLRKPRPLPRPASPSDVLDRPDYSYNIPLPLLINLPGRVPLPGTPQRTRSSTPSSPASVRTRPRTLSRMRSLPSIARGLTGKWKKTDAAGWVWIDVKERSASSS